MCLTLVWRLIQPDAGFIYNNLDIHFVADILFKNSVTCYIKLKKIIKKLTPADIIRTGWVQESVGGSMKIFNNKQMVAALLFLVILLLCGCAAHGPEVAKVGVALEKPSSGAVNSFPAFELTAPRDEADRSYLSLAGAGNFKVSEIKAPFLIIDLFSLYCPHCHDVAPRVNELYESIQGRPALKSKIKIIGIGVTNNADEVNSFREKHNVPFPLFPDQAAEIFKLLGARGTPTLIGVRVNDKGVLEQFHLEEGAFQDTRQVLSNIIAASGLQEELKK